MSDPKLYTLDEVAAILKLHRRTLYRHIKSGSLAAVKMGQYWRVTDEQLRDFIARGTEPQE